MTAVSASSATCLRCGSQLAAGQEYCLGCGMRRSGAGRFGAPPIEPRRLMMPLALLGAVAVGGASLAVALTREPSNTLEVATATGGSIAVTTPAEPAPPTLASWPRGTDGWTIVLLSVPKVDGRNVAAQAAREARGRGLRQVGVLDSSRFASLHPGYWLVFAGRYSTEVEARSRLHQARVVRKTSRIQRIAG